MSLFAKKRKPDPIERGLDTSPKRDDLGDFSRNEYGFEDEMMGERRPSPFTPLDRQPSYPLPQREMQPALQQRSFPDRNLDLAIGKIDVIDAKLDELARRLDVLERLMQNLQSVPPPDTSSYKGYPRRTW